MLGHDPCASATTLNSYDLADPVSWLSSALLFMTRVQRYTIMVLAKLWLTGAAFSLYCFIVGHKKNLAIICGSLAYTFSGTILFMFTRQEEESPEPPSTLLVQ